MAFRRNAKRISGFMKKFGLFLFLVFILSLTLPFITSAQIQTRVRIIEASNAGNIIDPSLRDIHDQLGSLFRYTSYRLIRDERLALSPNRATYLPFQEGKSIEITQIGFQKNIADLRVRIISDRTEILNTQLRLSPGRTVLIGGPKYGHGVAILAFTATF